MHIRNMRQPFALLLLSLFAGNSLAQMPGAAEQQYTVLGISVVGNRTGDAQTIIGQSGLYKGQRLTLSGDAIHTATQQLWSMGIFSDAVIVVDRQVPPATVGDSTIGLFLSFHVRELPHLGTDTISGNKQIKTPDIEKAMGLKAGDFVRPWEIESARHRARALYEKEGYHFATITISQVPRKDSGTVD